MKREILTTVLLATLAGCATREHPGGHQGGVGAATATISGMGSGPDRDLGHEFGDGDYWRFSTDIVHERVGPAYPVPAPTPFEENLRPPEIGGQ